MTQHGGSGLCAPCRGGEAHGGMPCPGRRSRRVGGHSGSRGLPCSVRGLAGVALLLRQVPENPHGSGRQLQALGAKLLALVVTDHGVALVPAEPRHLGDAYSAEQKHPDGREAAEAMNPFRLTAGVA